MLSKGKEQSWETEKDSKTSGKNEMVIRKEELMARRLKKPGMSEKGKKIFKTF